MLQEGVPSQCRLADDLGWLRMFAPSKVGSIGDKWRLVDTCGLTGRNVFIWVFCRGGYMVLFRLSKNWREARKKRRTERAFSMATIQKVAV